MRVTDYGGHATTTNVKIYATSGTNINQGSSVTLNTNGFSYVYIYIQQIANFMQIQNVSYNIWKVYVVSVTKNA